MAVELVTGDVLRKMLPSPAGKLKLDLFMLAHPCLDELSKRWRMRSGCFMLCAHSWIADMRMHTYARTHTHEWMHARTGHASNIPAQHREAGVQLPSAGGAGP